MRLLVVKPKSFLSQSHTKPLFQMESEIFQSSELGLPLWFWSSFGIVMGLTAWNTSAKREYPEYSCGSQVVPGLLPWPKICTNQLM